MKHLRRDVRRIIQGSCAAGMMAASVVHAAPVNSSSPQTLNMQLPKQAATRPAFAAQQAQPGTGLRLSLHNAIRMAIKNNLQTLLAHERHKQESARERESLSALLPNLYGTVSQSRQTENLRAQEGLAIPGTPPVVGPYDTFDARAHLVQSIFNLSAIRGYQAARVQVRISQLQESLASQQVASGTSLDYVQALRSRDAIKAAKADLNQAQHLLKLARDQHEAGAATDVDVVRAQTSVAQRRTDLIQAETDADTADLGLKRAIGVPLSKDITLTSQLSDTAQQAPGLKQALTTAQANRDEVKIDSLTMKAAGYQSRSAWDKLLPTIDLSGGYGLSGNTPRRADETTYSYGVQVRIPIFAGGSHQAQIDLAESQRRQAQLKLRDLHQQVDEDVRLALKRLSSARQQLAAAKATRQLASRELQLARDRFSNGAADNIEVVNAQASLANARKKVVAALAAYNTELVNLAAAMGQSESFHF